MFKQGGIQNQSSRVIDLIVESVMDYIDSICSICLFVLKEYLIERSMSVHAVQRKIASRNIKKEGIIIKFQKQSNDRVFDFIVVSVMIIHILQLFVCLFGVCYRKINKSSFSKKGTSNRA